MKRGALLILAAVAAVVVHSCGGEDAPVAPPPPANRPPVATGTIPAARMLVGDTVTVILTGYFSDPDNDRLTYTATVSNSSIATATVSDAFPHGDRPGERWRSRDGDGPRPGRIVGPAADGSRRGRQVRLRGGRESSTISSDLGAVVLAVEGPRIDSVKAAPDLILYGVNTDRGSAGFRRRRDPSVGGTPDLLDRRPRSHERVQCPARTGGRDDVRAASGGWRAGHGGPHVPCCRSGVTVRRAAGESWSGRWLTASGC